jgi:aminobenzoyl-glutamate transport protein
VSTGGRQAGARAPAAGWIERIERLGNALPDPITLFALGTAAVFVLSWVAARAGWSCSVPSAGGAQRVEAARNLLSAEGLRWLATDLVSIFVRFPPLGLVLTASIGAALAEKSGFLSSVMRAALVHVPRALLTPATLLVGLCSTMAADAGFVVLPPLAAAVYRSVGRPAALGIATVTAGIAGGFNANLFLTSQDPLLAGMSEQAARILDPAYAVNPACNWWFKIVSTLVLMLVGWFVSERIVAPKLAGSAPAKGAELGSVLTPAERRGLVAGLVTMGSLLALFVLCQRAEWGFLHDPPPQAGAAPAAPVWIRSIVALIVVIFFAPGLAYGIAAGTIRSDRDVARMLAEYFGVLAAYVVLAFFASLMVAAFERSNLGILLAVNGGDALAGLGLARWLLLVAFVFLSISLDLFVVSMSAKWALLAPIFVPLFMGLGIAPELTQAAYRVGDSLANPVSPLNPYLVIVLAFLRRHDEKSGLGTLISLLAPFALAFALTWIPLLLAWAALGIPLGPGGPLVYPPGR